MRDMNKTLTYIRSRDQFCFTFNIRSTVIIFVFIIVSVTKIRLESACLHVTVLKTLTRYFNSTFRDDGDGERDSSHKRSLGLLGR